MAILLRVDARGAGQLQALGSPVHTIGRSWDADLRVDEQTVSRVHARVECSEAGYAVVDLDSANGTYVNDVAVRRCQLDSGDVLQLGKGVRLKFALVSQAEYEALNVLHERGHFDPLTRVHNRRYLTQHLLGELAFAQRHGTELSVVMVDIDHFKHVNDAHGHQMGDRVLQEVANILSEQIRTEDTVARYGGEEFMLVLRGTPVAGACALAERIRAAVAATFFEKEGGESLTVTMSAGCASIACLPQAAASELIDLADRRLYHAKRGGRNQVVGTGRSLVSLPPPAPSEPTLVADAPTAPSSRMEESQESAASEPSRPERVKRLAAAFDSLDAGLRLVLGLFYQEQCSVAEIAQITGRSEADTEALLWEGQRQAKLKAGLLGAA